jgi:hypothetical protein
VSERRARQCLALDPLYGGRWKLRADHTDKGLDHHMYEGEESDGTSWSFIWTPPCKCVFADDERHCGECGCCPRTARTRPGCAGCARRAATR